MDRRVVLAAVALLLVAPVLPATGGLATAPVSVLDGTPRVLLAGDSPSAGMGAAEPSVGAAVAADTAALDSEFTAFVATERLAATNGSTRMAIARAELDAVADRIDGLRAAERRAYRGHANGTLTERELLVWLARVHAAAGPLDAPLDSVRSTLSDREAAAAAQRLATLRAERRVLLGPVREQSLAALRGQTAPARTFVQSSETGVVLATLAGETYYREAFRADRRNDDPSSTFEGTLDIINHTLNFYPWVTTSHSGIRVPRQFDGGGIRPVVVPHSQGDLTVYLDGNTREVFREIHQLDAGQMPTRDAVRTTSGSTTVAVNRTYAGGPALVSVTVDGMPGADIPVLVNGARVGDTGVDGQLRTLLPAGEVTVSAAGPENATVRIPEG